MLHPITYEELVRKVDQEKARAHEEIEYYTPLTTNRPEADPFVHKVTFWSGVLHALEWIREDISAIDFGGGDHEDE